MSNKLVRYTPPVPSLFNHRDEFLTSFDSFFGDIFEDMFPETTREFGIGLFSKGAYPKVDVLDSEDKMCLTAEIPGLTKSQVSIQVQDGVLTIKGEKQSDNKKEKPGTYIYQELKKSSFARSFQLNDNLDADKIDAKFENGVLEVVIPKRTPEPKSQTKIIDIK